MAILDDTNAFNAKKNMEEVKRRLKKLFPRLTKFKETLSGYEKAYRELEKDKKTLEGKVSHLEKEKAELEASGKEKLSERLAAKQLEADYYNLYRKVSQYAPELLRSLPDPQKKKELSL